MSSPSPPSATLSAIAAVSANDIWAVGFSLADPLALHWNGSRWEIVATPKAAASGTQAQLRGVTAVSSNDVWAVGFSANPSAPNGGYAARAEHWDGTSWSIVPTPNPAVVGPYGISLNAVTAISANDIWAVGGSAYGGVYGGAALLKHWDGSRWSIVAAPATTINWSASTRYGLAAVASNNVWAVGQYDSFHDGLERCLGCTEYDRGRCSGSYQRVGHRLPVQRLLLLLLRRAGGVPMGRCVMGQHRTPTYQDTFNGVSAIAAIDVWAVGTTAGTLTLTEHWDGTAWRVEPSPNASTAAYAYNALKAVVAIASDDVWAVGYYTDGVGGQFTLVMHCTG